MLYKSGTRIKSVCYSGSFNKRVLGFFLRRMQWCVAQPRDWSSGLAKWGLFGACACFYLAFLALVFHMMRSHAFLSFSLLIL